MKRIPHTSPVLDRNFVVHAYDTIARQTVEFPAWSTEHAWRIIQGLQTRGTRWQNFEVLELYIPSRMDRFLDYFGSLIESRWLRDFVLPIGGVILFFWVVVQILSRIVGI